MRSIRGAHVTTRGVRAGTRRHGPIPAPIEHAHAARTDRDADVAVRPTALPPENLLGRRLCRVAYAIHAGGQYLEERPARVSLAKHVWLAPDDSMGSTLVGRYMARELPGVTLAFRASSLASIAAVAAAGMGVCLLPCYLGDTALGLERVRPPPPSASTELWLLMHADLRKTARVRALVEFLADGLLAQKDVLEGRRPRGHTS